MRAKVDPLEMLVRCGLHAHQPFTTADALAAGMTYRARAELVSRGFVRRPLRGVYLPAHVEDTLDVRVACLRLVVPADAVVTDRTAGWLHGASMVLAPNEHLVTPPVTMFQAPGRRLRNKLADSGERRLLRRDVQVIGGVQVTTPLRTACDLGRLNHRDGALASLDALLRLGRFSHDDLLLEVGRFRGYRGVRQLRAFAPLADAGAESYAESALRLRWIDAGLPRAETQISLRSPGGLELARLDLGLERWRYAAEYDGQLHHGPDRSHHDSARRSMVEEEFGYTIDVFRREDVFGRAQHATETLGRRARLAALRQGADPCR